MVVEAAAPTRVVGETAAVAPAAHPGGVAALQGPAPGGSDQDHAIRGASRWKRRLWIGAAFLGLAGAAEYGWHWWAVGRFLEQTDDAYVRADVVTMSPKVAGYLADVPAGDNQSVRAGDVLLRIDDRDYRAAVEQAEGAVAAAEATVAADQAATANLDAQLQRQVAVIAGAEADTLGAEAELRRAQLDYARYRSLAATEAASRQNFETAEATNRKATAALARTRAAVGAERGRLPVLGTEREQAKANLRHAEASLVQAQAALALARLSLEHTILRAPVDGVVGQRAARVGQYVEPGQPVMAVVPLQAAYVVANFKETQLTDVHPDQAVEVAVDTFPDRPVRGRVGSISPASGAQFALLPPDNATGNFTKVVQRIPVKILLDPGGELAGQLRPGMSVVATVDTRGRANRGGPVTADTRAKGEGTH